MATAITITADSNSHNRKILGKNLKGCKWARTNHYADS